MNIDMNSQEGILMTLTDISTIASIVSSLAVAASLVYLGLQTHQNAKHTRALVHQGRMARAMQGMTAMAATDQALAFIAGNGGKSTPEAVQQHQFWLQSQILILGWEENFFEHGEGLLSDDAFSSFQASLGPFFRNNAGVRAAWVRYKAERPGRNPKFVAFVEEATANAFQGANPSDDAQLPSGGRKVGF
jgi:hypothetical protein